MNKAVRKAVIAGNWKMNKTPAEAKELITAIAPLVKDADCDVVACVPYVDIATAIEAAKGTNIKIGAENCHWAVSGAFTGEISAEMLKACGVEYVITGHSERRTYFGDTDVTVQKRTRAALDAGLTVIVCVGEYLEQREQGITEVCGKKLLGKIVDRTIKLHNFTIAAEVLDNIKATGYKFSTRAAISISVADMTIPPAKYTLIAETEQRVVDIEDQFKMGFMTEDERYRAVVKEWEKTTADVTDALTANMNKYNPIFMLSLIHI